jgi:hypothetical protein
MRIVALASDSEVPSEITQRVIPNATLLAPHHSEVSISRYEVSKFDYKISACAISSRNQYNVHSINGYTLAHPLGLEKIELDFSSLFQIP